ncbi:NAD-dependent protein deacetylase hst1 [Golovinomyces cichoracearum]|uniref:NAD-dependent protein deacetylase hst1 n=1 Tax=Golovinomyces cichoracearum TaxID=62708 RepID=A0A420I449_9PEZI|nr:NAD-dependent protein deacetylase hst1 [Golovinomyces cichoracearum]
MDKCRLGSEAPSLDSEEINGEAHVSEEKNNSVSFPIYEEDKASSLSGIHNDEDEDDDDEKDFEGPEDDDEISMFEDSLEELSDEALFQGAPDLCSLKEAIALRQQLRQIGPAKFYEATIGAGKIKAKKLLSAFGIRPPACMDGLPDDAYYRLLSLAISRELSKRIKLLQYNTVDDVVTLLQKSKNIIVITGAGISTSLGIPDFRSKDIGLYSKLEHLGLNDPQEVFDISVFREDPSIFYSIAGDILPETNRYTPTHAFIYLLQQKGKLLTNYSQNIDNIETVAGILPEKLIQCHGSFATASCVDCKYQVPGEAIFGDIKAGRIPRCQNCIKNLHNLRLPKTMKRKRTRNGQDKKRESSSYRSNDPSSDDEDDDDDNDDDEIPESGIMKPDITFFGEPLPDRFSNRLTNHDRHLVDLVIVIGTSLKVAPVSEMVPYLPAKVPQIYISRTPVSHINFDVDLLGECDLVVAELCRRAGWELEHEMLLRDQKIEVRLQEGFTSRYIFTEEK